MKKNSILIVSAIAGGIGALIGAGVVLHKKGYLDKLIGKGKYLVVKNENSEDTPFPTENDESPVVE